MGSTRDQTGDMGNVGHEVGFDFVGDLAERFEVEGAGVGRVPDPG